jgi:hypothetical protein
MSNPTPELKLCPFCGKRGVRKTNKRYRKGYMAEVGCASQFCTAKVSAATLYGGREEAYKYAEDMWNRRVGDGDGQPKQ